MTDPAQLIQSASAAYAAGDRASAERLCREALKMRPDSFEAQMLLGVLAAESARIVEAETLFRRAATVRPDNAIARNNLGNTLRDQGQLQAAIDCYDVALRLDPAYGEAFNNRGGALRLMGRLDEAVRSFDAAVRLRPTLADAHYNRGVALHDQQRLEEALESYGRAIALQPQFANAHYNLANALHQLRRYAAAVQSFERALAIAPGFAQAWNNRGNSLRALGRATDALASFERALQAAPRLVDAHKNRASALVDLGRREEALESYRQALEIDPHVAGIAGAQMQARLQLCDWTHLEAETARLLELIRQGADDVGAFVTLALTDDPALQRLAASAWSDAAAVVRPLQPRVVAAPTERIRVGYFSADFHDHATSYLAAELFELHDRSRFETIAFSFGPDRQDGMRRRMAGAFERFVDVREQSDREIAQLARECGLDIAVDLKGYTQHSRPGIFAHRPAPVQLNYLGYPGTMGQPFIDYLVADETVVPETERRHYSERIVYLPQSYQVNDRRRAIAADRPSRAAVGLPASGFVFCCFNNVYKITPAVYDVWMELLRQAPGSALWLLGGQASAARNLHREAGRRGVDPKRVVFADPLPLAQHLARYRAADLFLDTFPCGAHTTASDALWAGVPVLTRTGRSFASRVAASLLNASGLPELVTHATADYAAAALRLAGAPAEFANLKSRLGEANRELALFDTPRYLRGYERALAAIHERARSGLPPADLRIPHDPG